MIESWQLPPKMLLTLFPFPDPELDLAIELAGTHEYHGFLPVILAHVDLMLTSYIFDEK